MKVYFLNCGYLLPKYAHVLVEPEDGEKKCKQPVSPILIQTEDHNILFDTGSYSNSEGWPYDPTTKFPDFPLYIREGERLEEQLALCGLKPEDMDIVVLSHMHFDHVGGIDLFPNAEFYVPNASHPKVQGKRCHEVTEDCNFLPGIDFVQLPGHAPELMGMIVHLQNSGTMILAQDCIHIGEIYGPPVKTPVALLMEDEQQYMASLEKVRALEQKYQAKVIFGHDDAQFESLRHAPEYYD